MADTNIEQIINIQQILNEHGGSMKRSKLIRKLHSFGANIPLINQKLKGLEMEGSIKISGDTIILVPIYEAEKILLHGNINQDGIIEQTGHTQVSIPYDKTLFKVVNGESVLEEITVDEGMVDLLKAIWRHGILTKYSCQGGNGEKAWIRFQWDRDVVHFNNLIGHISRVSGEKEWIFFKESLEISFPPEHIVMMIEELNSKPIDHD